MASLADIRARLAAQENKTNKSFTPGDGPVYPHWEIAEGATAILRFLEDGNTDNPYFWVERAMFKFPFNGIKGDPTAQKTVIVQVPCMEMYGDKDPVLDEVRTWFKDKDMEDMGRKYWKKRTYLYQGFVRSDPMELDGPENPIRRFMISPQIHTIIKAALLDPDLEDLPTDQGKGLDLRITKTEKGGYADYTTSSWARRETALTEEELGSIETHGMSDLASFLPTKPTPEVLKVIREMFEASVDGEPYDPERWSAYYTPKGMAKTGGNAEGATPAAESTATKSVTKTVVETPAEPVAETIVDEAVVTEPEAAKKDDKSANILELIRSRQVDGQND